MVRACARLGWDYEVAAGTDICAVVAVANEFEHDRNQVLVAIFGGGDGGAGEPAVDSAGHPVRLTPKIFDAMLQRR